MRISDWSSDVCSSDLHYACDEGDNALPLPMPGNELRITDGFAFLQRERRATQLMADLLAFRDLLENSDGNIAIPPAIAALFTDPSRELQDENFPTRSEEHTSELQSLMRNSYAVFCLKKKINIQT